MRGLAPSLAIIALILPTFALAAGGIYGGPWESDRGQMFIDQNGQVITGTFGNGDGRIEGRVRGWRLSGQWRATHGDHRCMDAQMGSHYWGRYELDLTHHAERFRGHFSNCDAEPRSGDPWNGHRRHGRLDDQP